MIPLHSLLIYAAVITPPGADVITIMGAAPGIAVSG